MASYAPIYMLLVVTLLLFEQVLSQNPGCDFVQSVQPGVKYQILSPNYGNSYPRPSSCRWQAQCPMAYQCRLDCLLEMPLTTGCTTDRLLISRTGDPQLNNAEYYCGRGNLTGVLSVGRNISLALSVTSNSAGGRFRCDLSAQAWTPPPLPCSCGVRKQNRIVGGTNAGPNEFPMVAGLIERNTNPALVFCGAAIISTTHVLTAAHCLEVLPASRVQVIVGSSNKNQGTRYNAMNYIIHSSYNSNTYDYDIGLVRVVGFIAYNQNVGPTCLPFKFQNMNFTGRNVTLTGWGTLETGGPTSTNLQKVDVQVISQQVCQRTEVITSRQICTRTPGKDACQNDSGGSGLYTDPQSGRLFSVGIVSSGEACASSRPGVNTRVTEFLNWILNNAPNTYCVIQ